MAEREASCPAYLGSTGTQIRCGGILPGAEHTLRFPNSSLRRDQEEQHCYGNPIGCPVLAWRLLKQGAAAICPENGAVLCLNITQCGGCGWHKK